MNKAYKHIRFLLTGLVVSAWFSVSVLAGGSEGTAEDMWAVANRIIIDVYNQIAAISTVLACLMTAVAVIGVKMSSNHHKAEQAWDWLKRIWVAWVIINGIGAFLAYIRPMFSGLGTIS